MKVWSILATNLGYRIVVMRGRAVVEYHGPAANDETFGEAA
jgi:hypothetical protein